MARPRAAAPAALVLSLAAAAAAACASHAPTDDAAARAADARAVASRAPVLGAATRAALACGLPLSAAAQDRAAAIEAAAIAEHRRRGGDAALDAYLRSLAPPAFGPRGQGRDRAAWCAGRRPELVRVARWLDGADGAALAERAGTAAPR